MFSFLYIFKFMYSSLKSILRVMCIFETVVETNNNQVKHYLIILVKIYLFLIKLRKNS